MENHLAIRSMSSQILCSAWDKWESILLNPGRSKFNGIRTTIISANWIELWTIYGIWVEDFCQDSLQWESSMRFNRLIGKLQCEPENFTGWMIFMPMFNDIVWDAKGNNELRANNSKTIKDCRRSPRGQWMVFPGAWIRKEVVRNFRLQTRWCWFQIAKKMLRNFDTSGHPIFLCTSAIEWGQLKSNWGGKTTIHFNGSTKNIELLFQMVISVNHLSLYGAVAEMIAEVPVDQLDKQEIISQPLPAEFHADEERQGNLLQEHEERFETLSADQKLSRLCFETGLRLVEVGQFFYAVLSPRGEGNQPLRREYTLPPDQKGTRIKGWVQSNVRFGPVSDIKVCNKHGRYNIEVQVQSLFKDRTESWIRIVNGIDKFVREAMSIQEEVKASWQPAAKARPTLKPSSTGGWDFTPIEQRPIYCYWKFSLSIFITSETEKNWGQ